MTMGGNARRLQAAFDTYLNQSSSSSCERQTAFENLLEEFKDWLFVEMSQDKALRRRRAVFDEEHAPQQNT